MSDIADNFQISVPRAQMTSFRVESVHADNISVHDVVQRRLLQALTEVCPLSHRRHHNKFIGQAIHYHSHRSYTSLLTAFAK